MAAQLQVCSGWQHTGGMHERIAYVSGSCPVCDEIAHRRRVEDELFDLRANLVRERAAKDGAVTEGNLSP